MTLTDWATIRHRIGSRWSGYWPFWGFVLTVWCMNSTVLLGSALPNESFLAAASANAVAAALVVASVALWRVFLASFAARKPAPLFAVLSAGAFIGLVKGISTYVVFWWMAEVPFTVHDVVKQMVAPMLIGLWVLPTLAVVGAIRDSYASEREILISERVAHELRDDSSSRPVVDLSAFVRRTRDQLSRAQTAQDLKLTLTELAEHEVRPMSHQLWEKNDRAVSSYTLGTLAWNAIRTHRFAATLIILSLFVSLLSLNASQLELAEALVRSVTQCAIAWVLFMLARRVPARGTISGPVVFFGTPAVVVISIDWVTRALFAELPGVNAVVAGAILFLALCATALLLGIVFGAQHTHTRIREELDRLHSADISTEAEDAIRLIRRRETAELLHGYVHNQFLSAALRVGEQPEQRDGVTTEIDELLQRLESGSLTQPRPEIASLEELGHSVTDLWSGIVRVNVTMFGSDDLNASEREVVDRVLHELVSNAHRHGGAETVDISVTVTTDALHVVVRDDGSGPSGGSSGLGSHILSAVTGNAWTREPAEPIGTLVNCQIPRLGADT